MTDRPKIDLNAAFAGIARDFQAKLITRDEYRERVSQLFAPHKDRLDDLEATLQQHNPDKGRQR